MDRYISINFQIDRQKSPGWEVASKMRHFGGAVERATRLIGLERNRGSESFQDFIHAFFPKEFGWKHAYAGGFRADTLKWHLTVIAVRHPISWVFSLYKNPHNVISPSKQSFKEFLCTPIQTLGRENLGREKLHPLDIYARKLTGYIQLSHKISRANGTLIFCRFEDFVRDQKQLGEAILKSCDVKPTHGELREVTEDTKSKGKGYQSYRSKYMSSDWLDEIPEDGFEFAENQIDWRAMSYFNYCPSGW